MMRGLMFGNQGFQVWGLGGLVWIRGGGVGAEEAEEQCLPSFAARDTRFEREQRAAERPRRRH